MNLRLVLAGFVLMAASAFAADIDGKWSGNLDTPNGPIAIGYDFKSEGTTLTGTTTGPDGASVKIVDGNKVSFNVTVDFGGMPITIRYTGEVSGASLKLVMDFGGMPFEMDLKKA